MELSIKSSFKDTDSLKWKELLAAFNVPVTWAAFGVEAAKIADVDAFDVQVAGIDNDEL